MYVNFFIFTGFLLLFFLSFASQSSIVFSEDDGFFTIVPEDYYDLPGNKEESIVSDQLKETESSNQKTLQTTTNKNSFNIAVTSDWGCAKDTRNTVQNIQKKNPELVIAGGDLSYAESSKCWFEIIQPLKSKTKIGMGDHEYTDTKGGAVGITNEYLKPLNLEKTYYSFDIKNVHFTILDPYIDYSNSSAQYQFIENDLKTASNNPNIDWTFVVESIPIYTSPSQHPGNSTIRDIYHPLFDKHGVDLVFTSDNHNYQRTFPLKYNRQGEDFKNPIIVDNNQNNHYNKGDGVIYFIIGTAGRSLYEIKEQAPFVAKQDDKHFGFLNIDINGNTLKGSFYANEEIFYHHYINFQNKIIDQFTISKMNEFDNKNNNNELDKI